jgi:S-DNA-T family DNA segregation ATPase FtsK/SpoIIIE
MGQGGGVIGGVLATALTGWFGAASAAILLFMTLLACAFVATDVTPAQGLRAAGWAGRLVWRAGASVQRRLAAPRLRINGHEQPAAGRGSVTRSQPRPHPNSPAEGELTDLAHPRAPGPDPRHTGAWKTPPVTIFQVRKTVEPPAGELREQARVIEETLASFNIEARVLEANQGPAVTQFGIEPAIGVPVSRITARLNDLALRLGASPIRIEAPVPGRRMVGIEVPNASVSVVGLREVIGSASLDRTKIRIPLALGKDIAGKPHVGDLARMPHLLIAGATGSGKSVCINSTVACLLSQFTPDELQLLMIDPKMVELISYNGVPHLRMPVVTEMERVVGTLKWATREMERRYKLFAAHAARNIDGYNRAVRHQTSTAPGQRPAPASAERPESMNEADSAAQLSEGPLPYLVIIIDELADLMMVAPDEVEKLICRLAQLARATGIHLVVATQRPSVDVITGLIKANFPTRIAFAVTSQVDSRVILDTVGAERLLGRGDMLYLPPDASKPLRLQGTYVSDQEIESLVAYWKELGPPRYDDHDLDDVDSLSRSTEPAGDDLYERALELAHDTRRISVSLLQRRLGIGYPRAARLVDLLEEHGVISAPEDGRFREVLPEEQWRD